MQWNRLLFLPLLLHAEPELEWSLENSHIFYYVEKSYAKDYNRLRFNGEVSDADHPAWRLILKADNENRYVFKDHDHKGKSSIYRAYLEYEGAKHLLMVGKQRVPFGVGRIWNPTDVFNPIDIFAIETEERQGTDALHYEYASGTLSNIDLTLSRKKQAFRIKGYLSIADMAILAVKDTANDRDMVGWELSGELLDTGLELRSEGGVFFPHQKDESEYLDMILGAEYGFENSLTLLAEYRYEDFTNAEYVGVSATYQITPLWMGAATGIASLDDSGGYFSPSLEYSLSDESTLEFGAMVYEGEKNTELGTRENSAYIRWFVHF